MNRRMNGSRLAALAAGVLAIAGAAAWAGATQHDHRHPAHTRSHAAMAGTSPAETGQSAFAAIAEIVALLQDDPATDWKSVDIGALREHLVAMERLVIDAEVTESPVDGGLEIVIGGPAAAVEAARQMVPAHAAMVSRGRGWKVDVEDRGEELRVLWTSADPARIPELRGLGFFGLMAEGDHHRPHHLMIATGRNPHGPSDGQGR